MIDMKKHIRESNLIERIDDSKFDEQCMHAWKWLNDAGLNLETINHGDVMKLQKMITLLQNDLRPDERGYYRKVPVWIGGEKLLNHGLLAPLMDNWLFDLRTEEPMKMHVRFEKIHPFIDGNGRTGRMLLWWHEIKLGREPTLIRSNEADLHYYYKMFRDES